jgi:site-specific DNA recombinase
MKAFIYCRKSSEDKDRQIQSIDDQKKVMLELAKQHDLEIVKIFEESRSAKSAGRPQFSAMIDKVQKGEASIILSWKLDRLARNFFDGGNIIGLLQQGMIQKIITNDREYLPTDNVLMMAVEFGMANQFLQDLSKNVKRGNRSKWDKGWITTPPPLGYINNIIEKTIIPDEERFHLVRKIWDLMLTGAYNPAQIAKIAANKWGLKTRRKRVLGKPISRSTIYSILNNTFYYGEFTACGEVYQGAHEPMITREEFNHVQKLLGERSRNTRPSKKTFPFTGLLHCGECGCQITAEEKSKFVKSESKLKNYIYYRCTKKRNAKLASPCSQKSINKSELDKQVADFLSQIQISERLFTWAKNHLSKQTDNEIETREKVKSNLQKQLTGCTSRLDNLLKLKISSENIDNELLSNEEFKQQKNEIVDDRSKFQRELDNLDARQDGWIDLTLKTLDFCKIAKKKFENGTDTDKRLILACLGSNLTLKDRKLEIQPRKVFEAVGEWANQSRMNPERLAPSKGDKKGEKVSLKGSCKFWQAQKDSNPHLRFWKPTC